MTVVCKHCGHVVAVPTLVAARSPVAKGMPVPILAHAREWILNPKQQARLTQMLGDAA